MASVRDTVYNLLVGYPSLFTTVMDCYVHLFLVTGGGYEWVDGELVVVCRSEPKGPMAFEDDEDAEMLKRLSSLNSKPVTKIEGSEYLRIQIRREKLQVQFVIDNIDLMFKELSFISKKNLSYYGSKYNNMFNMPDDVKDDWRDAIRGFVFNLRTDVRQRIENNEFELSGLAKLYKDLTTMEQEKFPTSVSTRKTISEILKEIEDRDLNKNK